MLQKWQNSSIGRAKKCVCVGGLWLCPGSKRQSRAPVTAPQMEEPLLSPQIESSSVRCDWIECGEADPFRQVSFYSCLHAHKDRFVSGCSIVRSDHCFMVSLGIAVFELDSDKISVQEIFEDSSAYPGCISGSNISLIAHSCSIAGLCSYARLFTLPRCSTFVLRPDSGRTNSAAR